MSSYLITGASRGLGYAFLTYLAQDPNNIVIGLVRNVSQVQERVVSDPAVSKAGNIHIIQGDISSYPSLLAARTEVLKITPKIDVLINNAAALTSYAAMTKLSSHQDDPEGLIADLQIQLNTNVIGVISTINVFLPLVLKSQVKKVIAISTGLADEALTNKYDVYESAPYSISKAALNMTIAKYNAAHGKSSDRILFLAISPGVVDTGNMPDPLPENTMVPKFMRAYPHFRGPITPTESVEMVMGVVDKASVDNEEFAGGFVSHFGNKTWL